MLMLYQSLGWEHYEVHEPEPHILLFKFVIPSTKLSLSILTNVELRHRRIQLTLSQETHQLRPTRPMSSSRSKRKTGVHEISIQLSALERSY